jgi:NTE family protein
VKRLRVGLALGGGGAKGLAHIPMLEVFDELGVRPDRMAGTSIGAVIGALYASGIPGARIREGVRRMVISRGDSFRVALQKRDALNWVRFLDPGFGQRGLFKGDRFISFLYEAMGVSTFEELEIPLRVVATDFWKSEQVVFESGALLPAVKASMGLPGVFAPVRLDGRVLIDGGAVNPVPHDLLGDCDVVVAVDVMGSMAAGADAAPGFLRAVLGTFDIMQNSIIRQRLKLSPPAIYVKPDIQGVDVLDFYRADDVYRQAEPARRALREELRGTLERAGWNGARRGLRTRCGAWIAARRRPRGARRNGQPEPGAAGQA